MAKLHSESFVAPRWDLNKTRRENIAAEKKWFSELKELLRKRYPAEYVGEALRWDRADSEAVYVVVCVNPLTIAHVEVGDAWEVEAPLIRGLNLDDVEQMVERQRKLEALFANKEVASLKDLKDHGLL